MAFLMSCAWQESSKRPSWCQPGTGGIGFSPGAVLSRAVGAQPRLGTGIWAVPVLGLLKGCDPELGLRPEQENTSIKTWESPELAFLPLKKAKGAFISANRKIWAELVPQFLVG